MREKNDYFADRQKMLFISTTNHPKNQLNVLPEKDTFQLLFRKRIFKKDRFNKIK